MKLSNLRLRSPVSLLFKDKTWAGCEDAGWNRAFFSTWGNYPTVSQPVEKLQFLPGDGALAPAAVKICTVGCARQLELYTPRGGFMLNLL